MKSGIPPKPRSLWPLPVWSQPGTPSPVGGAYAWFPLDELPVLPPRHRAMLDSAVAMIRLRMDHSPVAFRLLPQMFTLGELQHMYELLLGKRLHKASFRRALSGRLAGRAHG